MRWGENLPRLNVAWIPHAHLRGNFENKIIARATILGDGTVALVMDTNKIIAKFSKEMLNS